MTEERAARMETLVFGLALLDMLDKTTSTCR